MIVPENRRKLAPEIKCHKQLLSDTGRINSPFWQSGDTAPPLEGSSWSGFQVSGVERPVTGPLSLGPGSFPPGGEKRAEMFREQ